MNLTVVLDIGQFSAKAGFAGEDMPSQVFFTIVGTPKYRQIDYEYTGPRKDDFYVGNEIQSIGLYKLYYPINKGIIQDWLSFEKIIDYIFYNLRVDPSLVNVLFAVHPLFPYSDLKRLFELFLENYQCRAFYPVLDSMLTLYAGGFQTGLVVEIGDSLTRLTPIYQGYKLDHAIKHIDIGGRTLTRFMEKILGERGFSADSSIRRELVRALKEKACFVSLDYKEDLKRVEQYEKEYSLPDGSTISLAKERFEVPELLFNPSIELEERSLPEAIMDVIDMCDVDVRPDLLNNIFLSGGSSMFPNIKSRIYQELEIELARRSKKNQVIKIIAPRERTFSVWVGGSILSMIPEFEQNWITRAKYFNEGIPKNLL
ncbi:MAG: actin, cytoplasmic 2 [Candidatus Lokiarchaeota archaeon]|nr:actin, cytoplasmic 2 [Candidatus Lokiarchaeota archaeon]